MDLMADPPVQNFDESPPLPGLDSNVPVVFNICCKNKCKEIYYFKTWEVLCCTKDKLWALDAGMRLLFIYVGIVDGSLR